MAEALAVDTSALARLAQRIRGAAAEARAASHDPGPLQAAVAGLGPACLVRATGDFVDTWRAALADLVADADRLADMIDFVARSYGAIEAANARRVALPASRPQPGLAP